MHSRVGVADAQGPRCCLLQALGLVLATWWLWSTVGCIGSYHITTPHIPALPSLAWPAFADTGAIGDKGMLEEIFRSSGSAVVAIAVLLGEAAISIMRRAWWP
jgi:hypothetical protein